MLKSNICANDLCKQFVSGLCGKSENISQKQLEDALGKMDFFIFFFLSGPLGFLFPETVVLTALQFFWMTVFEHSKYREQFHPFQVKLFFLRTTTSQEEKKIYAE